MKSFKTKFLPIVLTLSTVTFLTVLSMLYAQGYRLSFNIPSSGGTGEPTPAVGLKKTAILAVRSIPDSAKIYINDELRDLTNATVDSLEPNTTYNVKVEKEGFEVWEKNVEVYENKVTDVTALLVLKGGGLNPLTNTGVSEFELSNNGELLAYLSGGEEKPGLWMLQLSNNPLNIFQTNKKAIALDNLDYIYSNGEQIFWSPDDQEILIKMNDRGYLLVDLTKPATQVPVSYTDPTVVFTKWDELQTQNKLSAVELLTEIPENLKQIAIAKETIWSPDGEKFYTLTPDATNIVLTSYNFENPLPVGEKRINTTATFDSDHVPNIYWYSDSKHLLFVTDESIRLVNIDSTNIVELFSGSVISQKAFPNPTGDRVILLSKFKTNAPENLYTVSIR